MGFDFGTRPLASAATPNLGQTARQKEIRPCGRR